MKKVLLIGGSGFIGRNILEYFRDSDKYSIVAPSSKELNILDEDKVTKYLQDNYFDIVLNLRKIVIFMEKCIMLEVEQNMINVLI